MELSRESCHITLAVLLHRPCTMTKIALNTSAPDFELADFRGQTFRLSHMQGTKRVLLVFNRGFR